MKRKVLSAALLASSVVILGSVQPSFSEEYKLREAAEYVQARGGKEIPNVRTSEHFAIKWGNENNKNWKIDEEYIQGALKWFEHVRSVYKDQVGWPYVKSERDKYKINIYMSETGLEPFLHGYAFGFPDPDGYGVFDAEPSTMVWGHGASAHELGHSAEGETGNFRDSDYVGWFWECCAQFMAQQVVPTGNLPESLDLYCDMCRFDWSTAVNWHQYSGWIFVQYLRERPEFGYPFIVNTWMQKGAYQDEDPVNKMQRLGNISKDQWADIFGDYAKRSATYSTFMYGKEYKASLDKVAARNDKVLVRWKSGLEEVKGNPGWYRIPYYGAPHQNAYNIIPLTPTAGTISIEFKGLVDNYRQSDWRATIVAVNDKGQDRYSSTVKVGSASIKLKANEKEAYLVVAAAPHVYNPIGFLQDYRTQERFPYEVKIVGADPMGKNPTAIPSDVTGAKHSNGGGFVASTASVAPSAYVGPDARVLGTAKVLDNARIEDFAVVSGSATISGNAIVSGHAQVNGTAVVSGNARIRDYARIYDAAKVDGNARIMEYAHVQGNAHVYENVVARSSATIAGSNAHGTACFIGASNPGADIKDCSKGIYWKYVTQDDCDKAGNFGGTYARFDCDSPNNLLFKDSFARGDGFIHGAPVWTKNPERVMSLAFNGKDQYVELPNSLSDLRDTEISIWVKWAGGESGQKIFDFGKDTANCMYLTPKSESGKAAFVMVKDGKAEAIEAGQALPEGKWCQVTINLKGDKATMAIDGQIAASGTITANPEDLKADSNYLARGQQDGYFQGEIDDFRVEITD